MKSQPQHPQRRLGDEPQHKQCAGEKAVSSEALRSSLGEARLLLIFALLVAFSTLLSVLPLWAGLARSGRGGWWALTLTYSAIVVGIQPSVFNAVLGDRGGDDSVLWWLGFVEVITLLASLLLVRAAGYRLVRLAVGRAQ